MKILTLPLLYGTVEKLIAEIRMSDAVYGVGSGYVNTVLIA
jgi:hypothetical protein